MGPKVIQGSLITAGLQDTRISIANATDNCQVNVVFNFKVLFVQRICESDIDRLRAIEALYKAHYERCPLWLIDIQGAWLKEILDFLGHTIVTKASYTSTNGSDMCVIVFNVSKLLDRLENY